LLERGGRAASHQFSIHPVGEAKVEAVAVDLDHLKPAAAQATITDDEVHPLGGAHRKRLRSLRVEQELSYDLVAPEEPQLEAEWSCPFCRAHPRPRGLVGGWLCRRRCFARGWLCRRWCFARDWLCRRLCFGRGWHFRSRCFGGGLSWD